MKKIFRITAFFEGITYVILLFVAVPIKYQLGDATYVKWLGMPHGMLFMAYLLMAVYLKPQYKWNTFSFVTVLLASVIPFGTFYVDWKLLK